VVSKKQTSGVESSRNRGNKDYSSLNVSNVRIVSKYSELLGIVCLLGLLVLLGDLDG